jgi:hypothetical protein
MKDRRDAIASELKGKCISSEALAQETMRQLAKEFGLVY